MECTKCHITKELKEFPKNRSLKSGYSIYCKSCTALINKKYREKLGNSYHREYSLKRRANRKKQIIEYCGGKCSNCGLIDHHSVYDLHHLNPEEKDKGIGELLDVKWERLLKEVDKCVLLCANCHRKEHSKVKFQLD